MRYNVNPGKLQCAIRQIFNHATSRIRILGTEVIPIPLFEVGLYKLMNPVVTHSLKPPGFNP
jgi:hypothetical protein